MEILIQHLDLLAMCVSSAGAFFIWLVRLEGRVNALDESGKITDKRVDQLDSKVDNLDSEVMKELRRQGESLARIEGHLGVKSKGER